MFVEFSNRIKQILELEMELIFVSTFNAEHWIISA